MSATPFNQFSSSFPQNYRTVSSHIFLVTRDLENVGQYHNLQICSSLMAHSARSLPHSIQLTIVYNILLIFLTLHLTGLSHIYHLALFL